MSRAGPAVQATILDLGLRARPSADVVLGLDEGLYGINHTNGAADAGGLNGRSPVASDGRRGIYLAGDWAAIGGSWPMPPPLRPPRRLPPSLPPETTRPTVGIESRSDLDDRV